MEGGRKVRCVSTINIQRARAGGAQPEIRIADRHPPRGKGRLTKCGPVSVVSFFCLSLSLSLSHSLLLVRCAYTLLVISYWYTVGGTYRYRWAYIRCAYMPGIWIRWRVGKGRCAAWSSALTLRVQVSRSFVEFPVAYYRFSDIIKNQIDLTIFK